MEKLKQRSTDKLLRTEIRKGGKFSHASVVHVHLRQIHSHICADKKCRFYGKATVQGVCHTTPEDMAQDRDWKQHQLEAGEHLAWLKETAKKLKTNYVQMLENEVFVNALNHHSALDELVMTRRKNSILQDEIGKLRVKRKRNK